MPARKSGLGRGLDALFADNALEQGGGSAVKLRINEIEPNRAQPRTIFDEEALTALAESIAKHGVIQPILVRPLPEGSYQLVAGERRWRAARQAGLSEVPVVIRELSDEDTMVLALIENLQREDLNPLEEAQGYQTLMERMQLTQEETAEAVGKSRPAVANALRLLRLPAEILGFVQNGQLSAGHARALLAFETSEEQLAAAQEVMANGLSVRVIEAMAQRAKREKEKAPREKTQQRRASYFDEVELALAGNLGRKVKVATSGKAENGVISIDFMNREDLARIAAALKALED